MSTISVVSVDKSTSDDVWQESGNPNIDIDEEKWALPSKQRPIYRDDLLRPIGVYTRCKQQLL